MLRTTTYPPMSPVTERRAGTENEARISGIRGASASKTGANFLCAC
jgi:hypothetical protein